jgi:hypothetical protein
MKSFVAVSDSCHIHSSSPLPVSDQVHGLGYSESKVETDAAALELEMNAAALELETDTTALDLEMETDVLQGLLKQERYLVD